MITPKSIPIIQNAIQACQKVKKTFITEPAQYRTGSNHSFKYRLWAISQFFAIVFFILHFSKSPLNSMALRLENFNSYRCRYLASLIYIIGMTISGVIVMVPYNLTMAVIYKLKSPFFEQYRVYNKQWPWEQNNEKWKITLKKTLTQVLINNFFWGPLFLTFNVLTNAVKLNFTSQTIPDSATILWQILFFMLIQDVTFYFTHRSLHHPKLYWIHKRHHQYNNSITLCATYAHPIQFIFGNVVPLGLGSVILANFFPVHFITVFTWVIFRLIETCQGHSGYDWSWSITKLLPLHGGSDYHNFHHSRNVGNYGSFLIVWDTVFGTNKQYRNYKLKQQEQRKIHQQHQQ